MHFLKFLNKSKGFYFSLGILSLTSTITNFSILFIINAVVAGSSVPFFNKFGYVVYIFLIAVSFLSTTFFQNNMTYLTNDIVFDLEISIIRKLKNSSYESFEKMAKEKIYAVIGDASILGRIPETLIICINSAISILCALGYLFWISPFGSLAIFVFISVLLCIYFYRNRSIMKDMNKIRDYQDVYYASLRELIDGFKQIRISSKRNRNLFTNYILANRIISKSLNIKTSKKYITNQLSGSFSWYIVLGFIVFGLPVLFKLNLAQITTFITTILFIMGPVGSLVNIIPFFSRARISIERIEKLDEILALNSVVSLEENEGQSFLSIRFQDIVYNYGNSSFSLELSDFLISKNELIFIVGGNGSGKTTFINILTGLYRPVSGKIYLNDQEISWNEFRSFCNNMAVVFNEHRIFQYNYDEHDFSSNNMELKSLISLLEIDDIVKIDQEKNSLDTNLSKGQQKRIALLLALMENKPIIILDEWAAEQDLHNRNCFYTKWLQELKRMNKTLIIVSHDNDNFDQADRLVRFKYGKIVSDVIQSKQYI